MLLGARTAAWSGGAEPYLELASTGVLFTEKTLPSSKVFSIICDCSRHGNWSNGTFVSCYAYGGKGFVLGLSGNKAKLYLNALTRLNNVINEDTRFILRLDSDGTNFTLSDGTQSITAALYGDILAGMNTISLFARSDYGYGEPALVGSRLWNMRMIFDGEIVFDGVPAITNTGTGCIYDKVANKYLKMVSGSLNVVGKTMYVEPAS